MTTLTTKDVAAELRTTPETVRRLIVSGEIEAFRLTQPNGSYRVTPEALDAYRERQQQRDPWARTRPRRNPR